MEDRWKRRRPFIAATSAAATLLAVAAMHTPRPVSAFADQKAAGAELFATTGCAHCHGADGTGTDRAPALRELRRKLSKDKIRDQIVHGGQGMPAFGDSLKPEEVDELVSFLRAKKWKMPTVPAPAPPAAAQPQPEPPSPPPPSPPPPGQ